MRGKTLYDSSFEYVFPAIRGIQSGREYYVSMCSLRLIPKIFVFDEEELVPELRAQRTLNKARIPEMSRYIIENPGSYVFSAITASIDGNVNFEPFGDNAKHNRSGLLHVSMEARFIINDGQHRRAAIEVALKATPDLADETIAVVFFIDKGLEHCQQMFADLNRYAIRPSKSLGVLYDNRDEFAILIKNIVLRSPIFQDVVEVERSSLSPRSRKLFTLSSIYFATRELFKDLDVNVEDSIDLASSYWEEISNQFPEWRSVRERKMTSGEVRHGFIHSHSITLQALGRAGNMLLKQYPKGWEKRISNLEKIDWSRSNVRLWEGRALIGGGVSKSSHNIILTTNVIKKALGLQLTDNEQNVEHSFLRGEYVDKKK